MDTLIASAGTFLGVVAVSVLRDLRDGKSIFRKNGSYESMSTMRGILEEMRKLGTSQGQLKAHFNDDTTRLLEDILHSQREHNRLEEGVHQVITAVHTKLHEFEKYGIKTRETQ